MSRPRRGFIAVFSALVIAAALMVLVSAAAADTYAARMAVQAYEDHAQARFFAISCLFAAAYALAIDPSYQVSATGTSVFIANPNQQCRIDEIDATGSVFTISASASVGTADAHMQGMTDGVTHALASWKEVNGL